MKLFIPINGAAKYLDALFCTLHKPAVFTSCMYTIVLFV